MTFVLSEAWYSGSLVVGQRAASQPHSLESRALVASRKEHKDQLDSGRPSHGRRKACAACSPGIRIMRASRFFARGCLTHCIFMGTLTGKRASASLVGVLRI